MGIRRTGWVGLLLTVTALGSGCSRLEDANNGKGYAGQADTAAHASGGGQYSEGGFQAGDKSGWKEAMKVRAQAQNEYNRAPARD